MKKSIKQDIELSVIVPVYNAEKYIARCLESLINQKLNNYEIIVVNDGSTDNSQTIIDKYVKSNIDIIKSFTKKNGGISDTRNYGLKKARGKYITFVDSDDYVENDIYIKMLNKAKEKDFDIVVCNLYYVFENGDKKAVSTNIRKDLFSNDEIKKSLINLYTVVWNKIYKREVFNNLKFKTGVWYEDVEILYRMFPYIKSIGVVNEPLINYVQHSGSITKTYDNRIYDQIDNWNGLIKFYKDNNIYDNYKNVIEFCYVRYIYGAFIKQALNFKSKDDFNNAVEKAIANVKTTFPKYRRNAWFYKTGIKGIYLVLFNKLLAKLMYKLKKRNK